MGVVVAVFQEFFGPRYFADATRGVSVGADYELGSGCRHTFEVDWAEGYSSGVKFDKCSALLTSFGDFDDVDAHISVWVGPDIDLVFLYGAFDEFCVVSFLEARSEVDCAPENVWKKESKDCPRRVSDI